MFCMHQDLSFNISGQLIDEPKMPNIRLQDYLCIVTPLYYFKRKQVNRSLLCQVQLTGLFITNLRSEL